MANIKDISELQEIYRSENSIVWTGIDTRTGQKVAVKMLNNEYPSANMIARFNEEAELSERFNVKGVRKIIEKRKIDNNPALIMEYVEGASLQDVIRQSRIELKRFLRLAISASNIIGEIHKKGIIHKDVNPRNLLVSTDETIYVIDLGIASLYKKETQKLEAPERLEGTLAYISPEQTGRMNHSVDTRSDLYSLGITFYEMITGVLPFETNNAMELVHSHIAKVPETPTQKQATIPQIVSKIIMKMISKDVEERYQTADGLKYDIERCLEALEAKGEEVLAKVDFELGKQDFNTNFQIPEKLYGRELEKEQLLSAFKTTEGGGLAMLLVGGQSGIGKTALIRELYKPVTEKRSYFLSGKFEQFQRDVPYNAIIQAINGFVQQLLGESDRRLAHWKREILDALGNNAGVLTELIPSLELVIGKQEEPTPLPPMESQNRFNRVFQTFFKDLSIPKHSLVVFIDDWQWADSPSLTLLKNLMTDETCKYLLFIAAYRSNEVDANHPFVKTVEDIRASNTPLAEMNLGDLDTQSISDMLVDALGAKKEQVQDLAKLIKAKTSGNPFFVTQFFQNLYEGGHIVYNYTAKKWEWDNQKLQLLPTSNNVLELMTARLKNLTPKTLELLQLASCIGNSFPLKLLSELAGKRQLECRNQLLEALEQGFILPHKGNHYAIEEDGEDRGVYFRFLHDRVEQATNHMVDRELYAKMQWRVGTTALKDAHEAYIQENLFEIVNYLVNGRAYATTEQDKHQLAGLAYQAGKKAKRTNAYETAYKFLNIAIEYFGENIWQKDYDKAFDLYKETAESAFLGGKNEEATKLYDIASVHCRDNIGKASLFISQILQLKTEAKFEDAFRLAKKGLTLLGFPTPNIEGDMMALFGGELGKIGELLEGKQISDLFDAPEIQEEEALLALSLLSEIFITAFVSGKMLSLAWSIAKMTSISLEKGNSQYASKAYVTYGLLCCSALGNPHGGYEFGELAVKLSNKYPSLGIRSMVYHISAAGINHHTNHPKDGLRFFEEGHRFGLEGGDFEYAAFTVITKTYDSIKISRNLRELHGEVKKVEQTIKRINPGALQWAYYPASQLSLLNFLGETDSLDSFNCKSVIDVAGKPWTEEAYLETFEGLAGGLAWFYGTKMQNMYLMGFYDKVLEMLNTPVHLKQPKKKVELDAEGNPILDEYGMPIPILDEQGQPIYEKDKDGNAEKEIVASHPSPLALIATAQGGIMSVNLTEYAVLMTIFAKWKDFSQDEKEIYKTQMEDLMAKLKGYAQNSPAFYTPKLTLAEAEYAAYITGDNWLAVIKYQEAIRLAKEDEDPQQEGVAAERCGIFYLYHNHQLEARAMIQQAFYAFSFWGADGKLERMKEQYKDFIAQKRDTRTTNTLNITATIKNDSLHTSSYGDNALDLLSVMKASQAISQEIKLEALLRNMVMVLMENAGAERALLVQDVDDKLIVAAESNIYTDHVEIMNITPLSNDDRERVALSIIRQVYRKQETIVANNAKKDSRFAMDQYIQHNEVKSILCVPIIHQGKVRMVMYMEHNQIEGAFTNERIEILNMLSSQVAISVENASLYETMEQKVAARTAELAKANDELVHKNNNITSSIKYALRMQQAILPSEEELTQISPDFFVLYLPKDIVSGDFYWYAKIQNKHVIAAIDCTGHGVPGAFMSMIANTLLDEIVNQKEVTVPTEILELLHKGVRVALNQDVSNNNDGMDMCLCVLEKQTDGQMQLMYVGAKNSMFYVKDGEYNTLEADRRSIGGQDSKNPIPFNNQPLLLKKGDVFYLSTDGYLDQAGGLKRIAFSKKRLIEHIQEHWQKSMQEQQRVFRNALAEHQGSIPQRDDITLLGFRIA